MKGLLITLNQMVHTFAWNYHATGANGADMSAQHPQLIMLHHQLIKPIKLQSQEVEAPQNAQTQQPQASTSNTHKLLQHQLNQSIRRFISKCE